MVAPYFPELGIGRSPLAAPYTFRPPRESRGEPSSETSVADSQEGPDSSFPPHGQVHTGACFSSKAEAGTARPRSIPTSGGKQQAGRDFYHICGHRTPSAFGISVCVFTAVPVSSQAAGATRLGPPPSGDEREASTPWPRSHSGRQAHPPGSSLHFPHTPKGQRRPPIPGPPQPGLVPLCGELAAAGTGGLLRRPRPGPPRGGSSPAQPRPFRGCGSLTRESCWAPEPRPELPPAREPPPRGRQPQLGRLPGAQRSHHLLRRFRKWPPG